MIVLSGCGSQPLGGYLQGLGAWRALVRFADPEARAHWQHGRLVLTTRLGADELVAVFRDRFEPLPIVSPWNAGSGFAGNGKNAEAERALAQVRGSADPRLRELRDAVRAADEVVAEAQANGWGGKADKLWDDARKADVLRLCRNRLPDGAVAWLDAVAALSQNAQGDDTVAYSRLLGTGGNFGRMELQSIYLQRALTVLVDRKTSRSSEGWLRAALFADESTPYLRDAVGQFDPGRAGGIQSSPAEKADDKGFVNPWTFLLTIEGALFFASAATRRQGALNGGAAIPFMVQASAVGFGSSAVDEKALGEIWTPEWDRPATLAEIEHLLGEGRAQWQDRPARSGLDFVRAVATLGVDRGIRRFTRSVFAERLGQNPLAVPVGVVEVTERGGARLLGQLDEWLGRLRGMALPSAVQARPRVLDESMYALATTGGPAGLRGVLVQLGRLHEAVSRSSKTTERIRPLTLADGGAWWQALQPTDAGERGAAELRVAAALAAGRDLARHGGPQYLRAPQYPKAALRRLLTPVTGDGYLTWSGSAPVATAGGVVGALAAAHRLRSLPGAVPDPLDDPANDGWPKPAVRGVFSAFRYGPTVPLADVASLAVGGNFDDELFADYLRGLLLLNLSTVDGPLARGVGRPTLLPPALAILLPFYGSRPLRLRLDDDDPREQAVVLRPGSAWLSRLRAGDVTRVVEDAASRLRVAGVHRLIDPGPAAAGIHPDRLATALLVPISDSHRIDALRRVATLPSTRDSQSTHDIQGAPA